MIVVSDTSPLTALLTVGQVDLLKLLFGEVVIPEAVCNELLKSHPVLPSWLRLQPLRDRTGAEVYSQIVDIGEAEAIALAQELRADHVLMDERKGRRLAAQQGLSVVGLLGVILIAKRRNLIPSASHLLARLDQEAGIYLSKQVTEAALRSVGE
jgi:predicted nucleic acid-binding protein